MSDNNAQAELLEQHYQQFIEKERQMKPNELLMARIKQREFPPPAPRSTEDAFESWMPRLGVAALVLLLCVSMVLAYSWRRLIVPWLKVGNTPRNQAAPLPRSTRPAPSSVPEKSATPRRQARPSPSKPASTRPKARRPSAKASSLIPTGPSPRYLAPFVAASLPKYTTPCPPKPTKKPLKVASLSMPGEFNPLLASSLVEHRLAGLVFERLLTWGPKGKPLPALAKRWLYDKNNKRLTFTLRSGIKWHDGKPLTAQDVAFTLRRAMKLQRRWRDMRLRRVVRRLRVLNRRSIRVEFRALPPRLLQHFQHYIIPKHIFQKRSSIALSHQKAVGTGPFRIKRVVGRKIRFVRNKTYWRKGGPCLPGIIFQYIPSDLIVREVLRYGGLDMAMHLPAARAKTLKPPAFAKHTLVLNRWWYIGFNHRHQALSNRFVRQAIARVLNLPWYRRLYGMTPLAPSKQKTPKPGISPRHVKAARALLSKAGWRYLPGQTLLTLPMVIPRHLLRYRSFVNHIDKALGALGIKIQIKWLRARAWRREVLQNRRFALTLHHWTLPHGALPGPMFHHKGGLNYLGFQHRKMDRLWELLLGTHTPAQRKRAARVLEQLGKRELPVLPLWREPQMPVLRRRVKAYWLQPFDLFHKIHRWSR